MVILVIINIHRHMYEEVGVGVRDRGQKNENEGVSEVTVTVGLSRYFEEGVVESERGRGVREVEPESEEGVEDAYFISKKRGKYGRCTHTHVNCAAVSCTLVTLT